MGSVCRLSRSCRFIEEFNKEAVERHGIGEDFVVEEGLSFHEGMEVVLMYHTIRGNLNGEYLVCQETLFYDPEEDDEGQVCRVVELLGVEEEEARERIKKVNTPPEASAEHAGEGGSDP